MYELQLRIDLLSQARSKSRETIQGDKLPVHPEPDQLHLLLLYYLPLISSIVASGALAFTEAIPLSLASEVS